MSFTAFVPAREIPLLLLMRSFAKYALLNAASRLTRLVGSVRCKSVVVIYAVVPLLDVVLSSAIRLYFPLDRCYYYYYYYDDYYYDYNSGYSGTW